MNVGAPTSLPIAGAGDLEQLQRQQPETMEQEKARLKQATKEFESFFVYYMMKNMRKTIPENPFAQDVALGNSTGKEIFTDMFDMEVARNVTSGDGRSISEILYASLEKLVEAKYSEAVPPPPSIDIPRGESQLFETKEDFQPVKPERFIQRPRPEPGVTVPRPKAAAETEPDPIMQRYGRMIDRAANEHNLDSALIAAVIQTESSGDPKAVSKAGAKGLMQLRDGTAREMGVKNSFDPEANIRGGSRYLRRML
jgi:Rod binding domain-containing protein